jgi:tRNA nucleotidyltransferase (CCA-adding enzyme)
MRAYRQAAQLGFTIEPRTQNEIRTLSPLIDNVAKERIRVEIGYLLTGAQGTSWLTSAWRDGILANFFTNAREESFRKLAEIDKAAILINQHWPSLGDQLQNYIRETIKTTWLSIAKLACLVHPNGSLAAIELQGLTYSRAEIRAITSILNLLHKLKISNISIREQYFLFQAAGDVFPAIVTVSLANDILLTALSDNQPRDLNRDRADIESYAPLVNRFLHPEDLVAHPAPLISGRDIILALQIPASPLIGELLTEIAIARAEGRIVTVEEAIVFSRQFISRA